MRVIIFKKFFLFTRKTKIAMKDRHVDVKLRRNKKERRMTMTFVSFSALTTVGLDKKVNKFISEHEDIEIINIKFSASFGSVYAAILYQ